MNEKTCILIQGPLITFGQGPNISKEGFRSYESIVENTQLILSKKYIPVLCVWSSDTVSEEYSRIESFYKQRQLPILILDTPAKPDPDHRYKHHFAVYSGLEYAKNHFDCSFFIKIRTDQKINEGIMEELMQVYGSGKMLVSELMPDNNFYIGDFIYAGEYKVMQRYLLSQVKDNEAQVKYSTIGNDLGFNYYRSWIPVPKLPLIMTYLFFAKKATRLWETFINDHFITLSRKNWETLIWRDRKMTDVVNADNFLFVSQAEPAVLTITKGLSKHIYYVKGKYKRNAKKWLMKLIRK